MALISYSNLHNDSSLLQTVFTADGTNTGKEYNMIDGHEKGGSANTTAYVVSPRWSIRLRSNTWGLGAKSTSYATAYPYDPVTRSWLPGLSWNTAQASGLNSTKDATRGHNLGNSNSIENTYPQYAHLHLWKIDFTYSHSGANTGTYNYCVFYPSYTISTEEEFNKACKWKLGDEVNGEKLIYGIQPRIIHLNNTTDGLTSRDEMWRWYAPSEAAIIDWFIDYDKCVTRDKSLTGITLDGTGDILNEYRPNLKNICYCA